MWRRNAFLVPSIGDGNLVVVTSNSNPKWGCGCWPEGCRFRYGQPPMIDRRMNLAVMLLILGDNKFQSALLHNPAPAGCCRVLGPICSNFLGRGIHLKFLVPPSCPLKMMLR